MRISGVVVAAWCAWLAVAAQQARADESQFPYTAYVNTTDVYVRSGPGKNYYPTEKMARGDAVEVYRHDPGGWYAIKPPKTSFSWVPARLLQPTKEHLAVVSGDRVVSRVGSQFSDVREVIQVRLDRGEEVEVLDVKTLTTGGQPEQWCKIAPPSGEFRWVFGKFVDRDPPSSQPDPDDDRPAPLARRDRHERSRPAPRDDRYYTGDGDAADDMAEENPRDGRVRQTGSDDDDRPGDWRRAHSDRSVAKAAASSPAGDFDSEIDSIDLQLSTMVAEEPSVWKFDDLDHRAEKCLDHAQTAVERGKARLLLDRLAKFEDIKRRSDSLAQIQTATDRRNGQLASLSDAHPPVGLAQVEPDGRFDATGKLINVVSQRPNAPPYALLNADHEVLAFITPAPGVNLRPLLGRQVGVSGQCGFIPDLKKPHITVSRIEPLDQPADALATRPDPFRR